MDYITNDAYGIIEKAAYDAIKSKLHPGLFGRFKSGVSKDKARAATALDLHDDGIATLDFLRFFPNLDHLRVTSAKLANLSGLEHCPKLTNLALSSNWPGEVDLSPLKHCTKLNGLVLDQIYGKLESLNCDVRLYHADALAGLTELEFLSMPHMGLHDISWIESLSKLMDVELANNPLQDLEPLAGLEHLEELDLTDCGLKHITALGKIGNLQRLYLAKNVIDDFSPLLELGKLTELWAEDQGLTKPEIKKWQLAFKNIKEA